MRAWASASFACIRVNWTKPSVCSSGVFESVMRRTSITGARIAMDLGRAYLLSGRSADALAVQEQIAAKDAKRTSPLRSRIDAYLSESYLRVGRRGDAVALAERALEFARADKCRGIEAWILRLLGEIAACDDPPRVERAERYFEEAAQLAIELGMRPLVAHCHAGLAKLHRRTGQQQQADEHF